jgi:Sec-independent protein translocase protein TatA
MFGVLLLVFALDKLPTPAKNVAKFLLSFHDLLKNER